MYPFHLLLRVACEVVAIQPSVLGVEGPRDAVECLLVQVAVRHRDADLECLAEVPQVGGPDEGALILGKALDGQRGVGLLGQLAVHRLQHRDVELVVQHDLGPDVVVLHVDSQ